MKKTWTIAGALDLGLQGLGEHLECITKAPQHDWLYTRQLAAAMGALVSLAREEREARDPRNAAKDGGDLAQALLAEMSTDPALRKVVEQALREGRSS